MIIGAAVFMSFSAHGIRIASCHASVVGVARSAGILAAHERYWADVIALFFRVGQHGVFNLSVVFVLSLEYYPLVLVSELGRGQVGGIDLAASRYAANTS